MTINRHIGVSLPKQTLSWLLFLCVIAGYLILLAPTLSHLGISWDEEIDLRIANAYLTPRGFFFGIPLDNTQTRLPMFLVALVYRVLGDSTLFAARWASAMAGLLTLLAVYIYGKSRFGQGVGLLAAGLLAVSPFFLSFARVAFTESDIYLACTLSWLLVAVSCLQEKPTVGRAAVAGLLLGLSLASKATILAILPAIWIALYASQALVRKESVSPGARTNPSVSARVVLFWAGWSIFVLLLGLSARSQLNLDSYSTIIRLIPYGLAGLGWAVLMIWAARYRNHAAGSIPLAFLFTGIGFLTFLIFPPDHFMNDEILRNLFLRAENEVALEAAFVAELAALHLLSITFKSTLVLGVCLLVAAVLSLFQWRQVGLLLMLVLFSYFAGLLLLPLGQTFYTVPLLPILSLLAAYQFMRLWRQRRRLAYGVALLLIGWWAMEMIQCYPDYQLNGYQWLGTRALAGRSSIGYRSVVYTPSDGIQQAVEWLNTNAQAGQVAQLYVGPWHIVRYLAPDPAYRLVDGHTEALLPRPDYIVLHIDELIQAGNGRDDPPEENLIRYPFDRQILEQEYKKVFSVRRAFDIEMVSIWRRK